ncbi:T9SS type A sorting domain-containing protein [Lacinutrix sp. WUR7]|uniref:T9SS type A sorting domain-containing protein n=1 Tax=Lacinutrix sp. WUR7 TaxID=2653681 RepID=UPI00193D9964|nr:T9SS type A sorting domain-containing protein [Lacinutrix sp. WUR7]QRM89702.1 T9SS type A sorting domain-containing protein [Lacinutrix sp. WUR7]
MNKKLLLLLLTVLFSFNHYSQSSYISQELDCSTGCSDLTVDFPLIQETSNYTVDIIPFNPPSSFNGLDFGTALYLDDSWSGILNLPFDFSFYGDTYSDLIVGGNGVVSFDTSKANGFNGWLFSETLPNNTNTALSDANIFGAAHDMDASVNGEIAYEVKGTAPFRVFVVSFLDMAHYSCNDLRTTQMIVLHETTNVVEVFLLNKPFCGAWNNGNAVVGIQNPAGTQAVVPPGRNTGIWEANIEAWRFSPTGGNNTGNVYTWYDNSNQFVSNDASINVCPTEDEVYTAEITYYDPNGFESNTILEDVMLTNSLIGQDPENMEVCRPYEFDVDFNLTTQTNVITGGSTCSIVTYYESLVDAENATNAIAYTSNYNSYTSNPFTIYARVENNISGNFEITDFDLIVNAKPDLGDADLIECGTNGGFATFNLTEMNNEVAWENPDYMVAYYASLNDAEYEINQLPDVYENIVENLQYVYARVNGLTDECYSIVQCYLFVDNGLDLSGIGDAVQCGYNDVASFDLVAHIDQQINGGSDVELTFYLTPEDAENNTNSIVTADNYTNISNPQTVFVRGTNLITGCNSIAPFQLVVTTTPTSLNPLVSCETDGDGINVFDLTVIESQFINESITYYESLTDAEDQVNEIADPTSYTNITNAQTIYVSVNYENSSCSSILYLTILVSEAVIATQPTPLVACGINDEATFNLDLKTNEILGGLDPNNTSVSYYTTLEQAQDGAGIIYPTSDYVNTTNPQTIYVRVESNVPECADIVELELLVESCPSTVDIAVDCASGEVVNQTYCYINEDTTQFVFTSTDGLPLVVVFNSGTTENNYDAVVITDTDGTILYEGYGDNGDLTGLVFTSSGDSITVGVTSDGSVISCTNDPWDFDVTCLDTSALPNCDASLIEPLNEAIAVDLDTDLSWNAATIVVTGYTLYVGTTPGATNVLDGVDVGNVLTFEPGMLTYETTYYVTIVPYNDNGPATDCTEESFTTKNDPNQIIDCASGETINQTYCYTNNDTSQFLFSSTDGSQVVIVFNSGTTENSYDELVITDSDGTILYEGYGNVGDLSGLIFTSSGDSITVGVTSDGSVTSCANNPWDFTASCAGTLGLIEVNAFMDENSNAIFDASEFNFTEGEFSYEVNNDGVLNYVHASTGHFTIPNFADTNTYDISFTIYEGYGGCLSQTFTLMEDVSVTGGETLQIDFPITAIQNCDDVGVYLISNVPPRPGIVYNNTLIIENLGSTTTSGTVAFTYDATVTLNNVYNVDSGNTITNTATGFILNFNNLMPGNNELVNIEMNIPTNLNIGDFVTNMAVYTVEDIDISNNESVLTQEVVNSYDPNNKFESHGPEIKLEDFTNEDYLYYTINFQNLGTAEALDIRVEDVLDAQLDASTFKMLYASHDYMVTRVDNNLTWQFEDINLPSESMDEPNSHGFVYFRIKPLAGYQDGDIIPNVADIYFDFNPAITTNTFESEFVTTLSVGEFSAISYSMYPNPANNMVNIQFNNAVAEDVLVSIYNVQGKLVSKPSTVSQENKITFNVSSLSQGMYFVELKSKTFKMVEKLIID